MNEREALSKMIPPGTKRPLKPFFGGIIQILVTSSCNLSCYGCTQGSNLKRRKWFMTPEQFTQACESLRNYWGVAAVFGGCPNLSPHFEEYCRILRSYFPQERCGLWTNNLMGKGAECRKTFNPVISNLNVHLDRAAYDEMRRDWPESRPFGHDNDSRHSPPWVAMKDVVHDEGERWELISNCDINQRWSSGLSVFRGEMRAWFCEIAMAQSVLYQDDPEYPDTGMPLWVDGVEWWRLPMTDFAHQVRKHCHECGIPLRGWGENSQTPEGVGKEQVSETHRDVYVPKRGQRRVELVTVREQLGRPLRTATDYLQNARLK